MTLNGIMAVTLRYFTEFGKLALQKTICGAFMQESIVFLVRVQCRRKESSRSLSHLLMSFLLISGQKIKIFGLIRQKFRGKGKGMFSCYAV